MESGNCASLPHCRWAECHASAIWLSNDNNNNNNNTLNVIVCGCHVSYIIQSIVITFVKNRIAPTIPYHKMMLIAVQFRWKTNSKMWTRTFHFTQQQQQKTLRTLEGRPSASDEMTKIAFPLLVGSVATIASTSIDRDIMMNQMRTQYSKGPERYRVNLDIQLLKILSQFGRFSWPYLTTERKIVVRDVFDSIHSLTNDGH